MSEDMTIGTLARRGRVNVETIRYYQRRGLLKEPPKPRGGFRQYPVESVKRVRFIKRAQNLGFTLEEICSLLDLDERKACRKTRSKAAKKLKLVQQKISELLKIRRALGRLVRACDATSAGMSCPIIHLLAED